MSTLEGSLENGEKVHTSLPIIYRHFLNGIKKQRKLLAMVGALLVIVVVLSTALPLTLAKKSHVSIYKISSDPSQCLCGYYIPETDMYFTSTNTLDPSFFNDSSVQQSLNDQGWGIDSKVINTSPVRMNYTTSNVISTSDNTLQLLLSGGPSNRSIAYGAQLSSNLRSILYGSFRFTAMTSSVPGAVQGMFYYHDDNSEIDLEILSRYTFVQPGGTRGTGLQMSIQPLTASSAAQTANHSFTSFDPTTSFHEYRFDWSDSEVVYFADSNKWGQFDQNVPTTPGPILINNWSNGNNGSPPTSNSSFFIKKVVMYYNTTDHDTNNAFGLSCAAAVDRRICKV